MDHAGAILGPLIAASLLAWITTDLRTVFWLSAIPGAVAVLLIILKVGETKRKEIAAGGFLGLSQEGSLELISLFCLSLPSATLRMPFFSSAQDSWAFHFRISRFFGHFSMLLKCCRPCHSERCPTALADDAVIVSGWGVYAFTYAGFALAATELHMWLLFALYGLFYGLTEGVEKALLRYGFPLQKGGAAFGWYNFTIGVGALPASIIFGLIWQRTGAGAAFGFGALLACLAATCSLSLSP